jgi:hypothetical protein
MADQDVIPRTCFFVLGLIASTTAGCDILEEYGWMPSVTARGEVTSLCLPEDLSDFLSVSPGSCLDDMTRCVWLTSLCCSYRTFLPTRKQANLPDGKGFRLWKRDYYRTFRTLAITSWRRRPCRISRGQSVAVLQLATHR